MVRPWPFIALVPSSLRSGIHFRPLFHWWLNLDIRPLHFRQQSGARLFQNPLIVPIDRQTLCHMSTIRLRRLNQRLLTGRIGLPRIVRK